MKDLPNEQQLFYSQTGESWIASTTGERWPDEQCEGWLHVHKTWDEFQSILKGGIDLNEYKEGKKESMRQSCATAIQGLITSSALGSSHTYDCREVDQHNLSMMVNGGDGGEIYTHDGTEFVWTAHTHEQCVKVLKDMNTHIKTQRDKLYQKVSQINACVDCDEVDAIVW